MKKFLPALILTFITTSLSHAATDQCANLNNTKWHTDEFNADVNGGWIHCSYTGTVEFTTQGNNLNASLHFKKIKGNSCENEMHFEVSGTCGVEETYPIRLHDNISYWRGYWAQEDRIGLDTTNFPMAHGQMHGYLNAYFVK